MLRCWDTHLASWGISATLIKHNIGRMRGCWKPADSDTLTLAYALSFKMATMVIANMEREI